MATLLQATLKKLNILLKKHFFLGIYFITFAGFLEFWQWRLTHVFLFSSIITFILLSGICLLYARFFLSRTALPLKIKEQLTLQLLFGFFIVNTLLFILTITTPLRIVTSFEILIGCGLFLAFLIPKKNTGLLVEPTTNKEENQLPALLCLFISGLGATLWCRDALSFPINNGQVLFFPIWQDAFSHARLISAFAQQDGYHSLSNTNMADTPLRLYHYAPYMMSSVVSSLTGLSAYHVFASLMIPLGIFLTGLAAFSLVTTFWGTWTGLAATVAIVLLPDAYQQGFQNKFLSYYFLQQVGPAGLYGTACVALTWIFILEGCRSKKISLIALGYIFLAITLCYKAHLFVANAYLVLIYPCFFFLECRTRWRLLIAFLLTLLFCSVIVVSQHSSSIPIIRLDGSSLHAYATMLSNYTNPGKLHDFLLEKLVTHPFLTPWYQIEAGMMIFFCTLGVWGPLWIMTTFCLGHKIEKAILIFPLVIVLNYLLMSLGLAFDTRHLGMPEELVHRPFVWAYFAVTAWTAGGLYFVFFDNQFPKTLLTRMIYLFILLGSLTIPFFFAHGLQSMPAWGKTLTSNAVPVDMMKAMDYIRGHSSPWIVLQDSEGDPCFIVTGLTERQAYAISHSELNVNVSPALTTRIEELEVFKKMTTEKELLSFLQKHSMEWYLLRPETHVDWPDSFKNKITFASGGYRVYHWPHH